ncbi:hypothetical protein AAG906_000946 [Vitis piasezkii]
MGNQKQKSSDIEKEFVAMNDRNGEDTDPESPPGFSLSEPPIFGHPSQRNVARSSMDKGKSKMVPTLGKLPVKRTRSPCSYSGYKICTSTKPTTSVLIHESKEEISHCKEDFQQILEALFRIISGQWWTPADLFMAALFYFEDKVHLKQLQRAKKYPLFFPHVGHHIDLSCFGWQGSVTKTESTLTSASLTTDNEHHYVSPPNLILEDFGDGEDTPLRPPAATTLGATSTPQNPDTAAHILASLSSTPNIGPSTRWLCPHISEAFNQLVARLDMIQENQANI